MGHQKICRIEVILKWSPRRLLLPVCIFFGVLYAGITPPFQSPDEYNHFFRAWQLSEGGILPKPTEDHRLGANLPLSLIALRDSFYYLKNNPSARLRPGALKEALWRPLRADERQFVDFANTGFYAPVGYLPQTAAMVLLKPLGASPLLILYAARCCNLAVWVLLLVAALRCLPAQQQLLSTLALMPALLWLSATANADILVNGLCWWLTALLLSRTRMQESWQATAAAVAIALAKWISCCVLLAGGMGNYDRRRWFRLMAAGAVAAIGWSWIAQAAFIPYDAYHPGFRDAQTLNSGVHPAAQFAFIAAHPLDFLHTMAVSLFKALPSMAAHFAGKFGWEKNYLPAPCLALLWGALAAVLCTESSALGMRRRAALATVALAYMLAFAVTMYALWTAVGSSRFDNWQARYFTPIALLLGMAIANNILKPYVKYLYPAAAVVLTIGHIVMASCIVGRYW